ASAVGAVPAGSGARVAPGAVGPPTPAGPPTARAPTPPTNSVRTPTAPAPAGRTGSGGAAARGSGCPVANRPMVRARSAVAPVRRGVTGGPGPRPRPRSAGPPPRPSWAPPTSPPCVEGRGDVAGGVAPVRPTRRGRPTRGTRRTPPPADQPPS